MNCPACGRETTEMPAGDVMLDVCQGGCGGIWFDRFELKKLDEPNEDDRGILLRIKVDPGVKVDHSVKRKCPKCDNLVMMQHFFSVKSEVMVDECPGCGGFWLDEGELIQIRNQFSSEEERNKAARKHFSALFDNELNRMRAESEAKRASADKIARALRFLAPSYYIPDDQDWGGY